MLSRDHVRLENFVRVTFKTATTNKRGGNACRNKRTSFTEGFFTRDWKSSKKKEHFQDKDSDTKISYCIVRKFRGKKISRLRPFAKFSWFRGNLISRIKENYAFSLFLLFSKKAINISFRLLTRFYVLHTGKIYCIIHNC